MLMVVLLEKEIQISNFQAIPANQMIKIYFRIFNPYDIG
jgi:hypothetical protein